ADYVDWELVKRLAEARIGSLVFVGPPRQIQDRFDGQPNIHVLGPRPYADLPRYIHAFDVCMIPANRQPAALASNPGKLYQYLASGKPIVSTNLPEIAPYRDVIAIAGDAEEFIAQVKKATVNLYDQAFRRRQFAQEAAWSRRAEVILKAIKTAQG